MTVSVNGMLVCISVSGNLLLVLLCGTAGPGNWDCRDNVVIGKSHISEELLWAVLSEDP